MVTVVREPKIYKMIRVDENTYNRLKLLASGKPLAQYLRDLTQELSQKPGEATVNERLKNIELKLDRQQLLDGILSDSTLTDEQKANIREALRIGPAEIAKMLEIQRISGADSIFDILDAVKNGLATGSEDEKLEAIRVYRELAADVNLPPESPIWVIDGYIRYVFQLALLLHEEAEVNKD